MPIDPNIALSYRPPNLAQLPNLQIQTPLESLARVVSLRSLMQEGQLKGLQLDQLRQQIAEQKTWAQMLGNIYGGGTTGTGAPPAAGAPLTAAPGLPQPDVSSAGTSGIIPMGPVPGGAPVTPSGVDVTAGLGQYLPPAQPTLQGGPQAPTVNAAQLMAPPAAPQASQPVQPVPQQISPASQQAGAPSPLWWPAGVPSPTTILQRLPITGPTIVKQIEAQQTSAMELAIKQQTIAKGKTEEMVRLANGSIDEPSFQKNLIDAGNQGLLSWDEVRQRRAAGFDDPQNKSWLKSQQLSAVNADKQLEMNLNLLRFAMESESHGADMPKKIADAKTADYLEASNAADDLRTQNPAVWLHNRGPYAAQRYADLLNSNIPLEQQITAIKMGAGGGAEVAKAGATTTATEEAKQAVLLKQYEPIVQGVVSGAIPWDSVDPEIKKVIQPEVQRRQAQPQPAAPGAPGAPGGTPTAGTPGTPGTSVFAKQVSDAERQRITDLDNAINLLEGVNKTNQDPYYRSFMGFPSNVLKYVPGVGIPIQKLQAQYELAKQKLKAFATNKSLRGVTPESLDEIFPSVGSAPSVNDFKIQNLLNQVRMERAQAAKDLVGKNLPPGMAPLTDTSKPSPSGTVRMKAPGPNGLEKEVPADQVDYYKKKGATVVQ